MGFAIESSYCFSASLGFIALSSGMSSYTLSVEIIVLSWESAEAACKESRYVMWCLLLSFMAFTMISEVSGISPSFSFF